MLLDISSKVPEFDLHFCTFHTGLESCPVLSISVLTSLTGGELLMETGSYVDSISTQYHT